MVNRILHSPKTRFINFIRKDHSCKVFYYYNISSCQSYTWNIYTINKEKTGNDGTYIGGYTIEIRLRSKIVLSSVEVKEIHGNLAHLYFHGFSLTSAVVLRNSMEI